MSGAPRRVLLPTQEAAAFLGVTPATIRDWKRRGLVMPAGRNRWDLVALRRAQAVPKPRRATSSDDQCGDEQPPDVP